MQTITINKQIKAQQYVPGIGAPDGATRAKVELHWSADKKLIYCSFANMQARHWMGVQKFKDEPAGFTSGHLFDGGWCKFNSKASSNTPNVYYRECLSFSFFEVKSLASATQNWQPVWLDQSNDEELELAADYISLSGWVKEAKDNEMFEDTVMVKGIADGRSQSFYLRPTDWLLIEDGNYKVVTDHEFMQLQAVTAA